jgi:hypothetical protein
VNLKFHDDRGNEISITDFGSFTDFVQSGKLRPETLVFNHDTSVWTRADEYEQYSAASLEIHARQINQTDTPFYGAVPRGLGGTTVNRGLPWLSLFAVALVLFALTMLVVSSVAFSPGSDVMAYRIGTAIGYSIWIALAAYLTWRFALSKKRGTGLIIFALGFFIICLLQSFAALVEANKSKQATNDIALMMRDAMNDKLIDPMSIDAGKYGNATPMMKVFAEYAAQIQTDFRHMNQEIAALELDTLLAPDRLQDVVHIDSGQRRLQAFLKILDRHEVLFRERADEVPTKVDQSGMSSQAKREFLAGFNENKEAGIRQISEFFEIERNFVSKTDELFNFMRGRQRLYRFVGNEIEFRHDRDADIYNGLLAEIDAVAEQETDWRTRTSQASEVQIDKLQRETKPKF